MRISHFTVRAVNPPLATPHATASGTVTHFPMVLLDLHTDEGVSGCAYVFTYGAWALKPVAELLRAMEPMLKGQPCAPQAIEQMLRKRMRLIGPHGLVTMAMAAIDMAAWDAHCKAAGLPLYAVLGGTRRASRAYGPVGMSGMQGSAQEAEAQARLGFTAVKAKIGYGSVDEDRAVIDAMRRTMGPGVRLMVDYNQALDVPEGMARCKALDAEGLVWIEEPTTAEDLIGHGRIKDAAVTPIQAGENWWGPLEFRKAINAGASDLLMPDVMKIGGITNWLKIMAMAEVYGTPLSNHLFPEVSAHLMAVSPTAGWFEFADWSHPILAEPLDAQGGQVLPSDKPGIGLTWDESAIQRFLVE
jgi:mandelate racemase